MDKGESKQLLRSSNRHIVEYFMHLWSLSHFALHYGPTMGYNNSSRDPDFDLWFYYFVELLYSNSILRIVLGYLHKVYTKYTCTCMKFRNTLFWRPDSFPANHYNGRKLYFCTWNALAWFRSNHRQNTRIFTLSILALSKVMNIDTNRYRPYGIGQAFSNGSPLNWPNLARRLFLYGPLSTPMSETHTEMMFTWLSDIYLWTAFGGLVFSSKGGGSLIYWGHKFLERKIGGS